VADAIAYLRTHPDEAARMGQKGAQLVAEQWSVKAAVDRLEQNLQTVLNDVQQVRKRDHDGAGSWVSGH
jgi:hypothetical protein